MGRVHKGPRVAQSVRIPVAHREHYRARATALRIPVSDYVMARLAVAEGLPIPPEIYRAHPGVLLVHPVEEWAALLDGMPPVVAERVRRHLTETARDSEDLRADLAAAGLSYLLEEGTTLRKIA